MVQRLVTAQVLDAKGAKYVVETMWMLMEAGIEEVGSEIRQDTLETWFSRNFTESLFVE